MKLTLDRKAIYRIKIPGEVRKLQLGIRVMKIEYKQIGADDHMITILTIVFDQAGLHGFLRRLYALGLPLIEVTCLDCPCDD